MFLRTGKSKYFRGGIKLTSTVKVVHLSTKKVQILVIPLKRLYPRSVKNILKFGLSIYFFIQGEF